jgi:hypothetical protein
LRDAFYLTEEDRVGALIELASVKASNQALAAQLEALGTSPLISLPAAENLLLDRQAETVLLQREITARQHDHIFPIIQQLSALQGIKILQTDFRSRGENEERTLVKWRQLHELTQRQEARLEIFEAQLEIENQRNRNLRALANAAAKSLQDVAHEKSTFVGRFVAPKIESSLQVELPLSTLSEQFLEDCTRICAALGGGADKFAMAFPTKSDVVVAANHVGASLQRVTADRALTGDQHLVHCKSLLRCSRSYERTLHRMPAGPGRPVGMPEDLEEALQALGQESKEAEQRLEEVLQYRDAARQAPSPGPEIARVIADFYTNPQRLQGDTEALRIRCASTSWRPPLGAAPALGV